MGLEEEAVRAALMGMTDLPAGVEGPSLPTPQQAGLNSTFAGGATQYEYPMNDIQGRGGLPVGATVDSASPLGYTIADPLLRAQAANFSAGLAKAVANQNYMDAYMRDRQKNTMEMLKASSSLDPDMQALVLQRLGLSGAGGFDKKLRDAMMLEKFKNELNAPDKDMQRTIQMLQAQAALATSGANADYRRNLTDRGGMDQQIKMLGLLDNLTKAYQIASQPPGLGGNPEMAKLYGGLISHIGRQFMPSEGGTGTPATSGGDAFTTTGTTPTPAATTGRPWWDQAMPSDVQFTPDRNKIAGLLAQLEHIKKFAPGDLGAQMAIQRQLQDAMLPPIRQPGQGSSAVRPKVTKVSD